MTSPNTLPGVPPSQMKPGNRVTWQTSTGHRSGTVWCQGAAPRSLWVIPDGQRRPVAITYRRRSGVAAYEQPAP